MYLFDGIELLNKYKMMSYIYYKTSKKENYITTNQNLPRQYMRRKVAKEENEMSELEKLRAENKLLQAEKRRAQLEAAFLKNSTKSKGGGSKPDTK